MNWTQNRIQKLRILLEGVCYFRSSSEKAAVHFWYVKQIYARKYTETRKTQYNIVTCREVTRDENNGF